MKKLIIIISLLSTVSCVAPGSDHEYQYNGVVLSKGYESPTSGYKSHRDAVYYIMMREHRSSKVIRVNVTVPVWYSLNENDETRFVISNWDLCKTGNTTDYSKNLYEQ